MNNYNPETMANQQLSIEDYALARFITEKTQYYYLNNLVPVEYWVELTDYLMPNIEILSDGHGRYLVSDLGRVFDRKRLVFVSQWLSDNGYVSVHLSFVKEGDKKVRVHRLVMIAFHHIDDYITKQVNHKDGVRQNNYIENLEWCTPKENMQHAIANNLIMPKGEDHYRTWLTEEDAIYICELLQNNAPYDIIIQGLKRRGVTYDGPINERKAFYEAIYNIHHRKTWKQLSARYTFQAHTPKSYIKFTDNDVRRICEIYVSGDFRNVEDIMRKAGFDIDRVDEATRTKMIQFCYSVIYKKRRTKISDQYFERGFKPDKKKD